MSFGIIRWMRRVIPSGEYVTAVIVVEMLIECAYPLSRWLLGVADEVAFRQMRFSWMLISAFGYGYYRIVAFHPAADSDYRDWLEQTPWTADKPLPGGPLQLVPQDLVVVCALSLLPRTPSLAMLYIPTAFLVGYQLTLAVVARIIGHWRLAYLIGFALGGVMLFADRPEAAFAVADGCFIIGRIAVDRALRTFPWDLPWQADMRSFKAMTDEAKRRRLGWPYDQMAPKAPELHVPVRDGLCLSILGGWWCFVVLIQLPSEGRLAVPAFLFFGGAGAGIFRIGYYMLSHRSPISFFGRIFTFRWIIPGYDRIFVAPILSIIVNGTIQFTAFGMMVPQNAVFGPNSLAGMAVCAIGMTATLLLLLVAGPALEHWRFAGKHRIVFDLAAAETVGKGDQFVEL